MMKEMKSKHYIKKILSFLTVICCLAGSLMPYTVQAGNAENTDTNPRIVFTNEPKKEANLNVFKFVESADGSKVPAEEAETEFEFILTLNEKPAKNVIYHLYNGSVEAANEVPAGTSDKDKFKTGSSGSFFLKAGQIAVFRSEDNPLIVGDGVKYAITEETAGEKYNLLQSENATGSITENGATAKFTNEYLPQGKGKDATLDIVKTVVFPDGYKAPETPDFTFRLKLNNEVCANTEYEIIDTETKKAAGTGTTDTNGIFTLKGGYTVRFTTFKGEKIKTGVQYEVTEMNLPEGWRATGDNRVTTEQSIEIGQTTYKVAALEKGSTTTVTRVFFSNISAAFGVSKHVEGDTKPDIDFAFELTHGDRSVWPEVKYYLYNAAGNQIFNTADDAPEDGHFATNKEDGRFTLKHGQTAIFYDIPAGEKYNVREIRKTPGNGAADNESPAGGSSETIYVQSQPKSLDGYTDNTVGDSTPVWEFKNKPSTGGLTITKSVTNSTGDAAFRNVDFKFILYKGTEITGETTDESTEEQGETGDTDQTGEAGTKQYNWEVVSGELFERNEGGTEEEGTTGEDGSFTLKPYGTIVFPYLGSGHYKVVEDLSGTPEYSAAKPDMDGEKALLTQTLEADYEAGSTLELPFENIYEAWKFDLRMVKEDGEGNALEGAQFRLYWDEEQTNPVTAEAEAVKEGEGGKGDANDSGEGSEPGEETKPAEVFTFTTGNDGIAVIPNLKSGTYILEEAKAPSGYAILFAPIKLEVTRTEDGIQVILDDGNADPDIVQFTGTKISTSNENDLVEITVYNTQLYELPSSGGIGIYWYSIGGMLLMMAAALILYRKNVRGRC